MKLPALLIGLLLSVASFAQVSEEEQTQLNAACKCLESPLSKLPEILKIASQYYRENGRNPDLTDEDMIELLLSIGGDAVQKEVIIIENGEDGVDVCEDDFEFLEDLGDAEDWKTIDKYIVHLRENGCPYTSQFFELFCLIY